jgi:hypothetical protein
MIYIPVATNYAIFKKILSTDLYLLCEPRRHFPRKKNEREKWRLGSQTNLYSK